MFLNHTHVPGPHTHANVFGQGWDQSKFRGCKYAATTENHCVIDTHRFSGHTGGNIYSVYNYRVPTDKVPTDAILGVRGLAIRKTIIFIPTEFTF